MPRTYGIVDPNDEEMRNEEIVAVFYKRELLRTNQTELIIERVIKKKGDKLYVEWKGYDNSFNRWEDKNDIR